jgi:hypothetical protein
MTGDDRLDSLRKRLRQVARAAEAAGRNAAVSPAELLLVLDALGRAAQGGERLRRQNRRLRLRCQRLGIETDVDEESD